MYRYELDQERKILVLVVHGSQDGWEAQLMRIDWPRQMEKIGSDWTFILDLSDYVSPQTPAAMKEQKKLAGLVSKQGFASKMIVKARIDEVNAPFSEGVQFEQHGEFLEAWRKAGGDPRNQRLNAPADGSRFPANNPPPSAS